MPPRPRVEPTDWHQTEHLAWAPGQRTGELTRPGVLVGHFPADHRRQQAAPVAEKEIATEVLVESVDVLGRPARLFLNVVCTVRVDYALVIGVQTPESANLDAARPIVIAITETGLDYSLALAGHSIDAASIAGSDA